MPRVTTTIASLTYYYPGTPYRTSSGYYAAKAKGKGRQQGKSWHEEISENLQTRLRRYGELS